MAGPSRTQLKRKGSVFGGETFRHNPAMLGLAFIVALSPGPREIPLTPQTNLIKTDVRIKPGVYTMDDRGGGAIQIDADGVTVDFQGATLQSSKTKAGKLEDLRGIGVAVWTHRNVTIKNAVVHGFGINVKAYGCRGLKLVNCELSISNSQRMLVGDSPTNIWVDIHNWRGDGAGAWLEKCSDSLVKGVVAARSRTEFCSSTRTRPRSSDATAPTSPVGESACGIPATI